MKYIGLKIKELRKSRKLTLSQLSVHIKVDSSQLSKIERGELNPTIVQLLEFSSFFEVTLDHLCKKNNTDKVDTIKSESNLQIKQSKRIPLIPTHAFAGIGGGIVSIMDQDIMERYSVPDFTNVDFMIRIKGSSMYPKYNSGDVVACKMINSDSFLQWNKVHVISTKEQGVLIKRLKKSSKDNFITAVSDNKDYDPFDIPKDEILNIALVTGVIRLE